MYLLNHVDHAQDFLVALLVAVLLHVVARLPEVNRQILLAKPKWLHRVKQLDASLRLVDVLVAYESLLEVAVLLAGASVGLHVVAQHEREDLAGLAHLRLKLLLGGGLGHELHEDVRLVVLFHLVANVLRSRSRHRLVLTRGDMLLNENAVSVEFLLLVQGFNGRLSLAVVVKFHKPTSLLGVEFAALDLSEGSEDGSEFFFAKIFGQVADIQVREVILHLGSLISPRQDRHGKSLSSNLEPI